ncbi:5724_t:CDS:2, partial [Entrophospora sp. SA101]
GKLPEITNDTPQFYAILMKECWDPNPENRPDFGKIHEDFKKKDNELDDDNDDNDDDGNKIDYSRKKYDRVSS